MIGNVDFIYFCYSFWFFSLNPPHRLYNESQGFIIRFVSDDFNDEAWLGPSDCSRVFDTSEQLMS